ncbi:MAG: hypothetical protein Q8S73_35950 [Deltaproteobacteria bacterium]|nr:hypothetical protein [Myxococcales bacterium]MDP3219551.1 hypothetical protein [Deltaproteobacteria bacterium]
MEMLRQSPSSPVREPADRLDQLFQRLDSLDHYELLGVARDAPSSLIQRAYGLRSTLYRSLASAQRQTTASASRAHAVLCAMDAAWRVLGDPARRVDYDRRLGVTHPANSAHGPIEPFSRAERAQEVFSVAPCAPSAPPAMPTPAPPPPPMTLTDLAERGISESFRPTSPTSDTVRPPMLISASMRLSPESLRPPRVPTLVDAPASPDADPWGDLAVSMRDLRDEVDLLCGVLQSTLNALAAHQPGDPSLDAARRGISGLQARHAAQAAHDHERRGRWRQASRAWLGAAEHSPNDAWLVAHAARTLLASDGADPEGASLARRALRLDPANPLARSLVAMG